MTFTSDIADRYRRRADAFEALIAKTPPERWTSPSPCEGWLARDVVAHVVEYSAYELRNKAGVSLDPSPPALANPAEAFRRIRDAVERTLEDPMTPSDVLEFLDAAVSFDLPQHWWDLAKATGQDATMDAEEVDAMWVVFSRARPQWWKWQRDHGWYGPPVAVPEDAPLQDRVLGLIGRDPKWAPPR
jgi:uncharacterized protein (TIGR03086 family)